MNNIENNVTTVKLEPVEKASIIKFIVASVIGGFLFLVPIPYGTTFTIPIGIVIDWVSGLLKLENIDLANLLVLVFITFSSIMTIVNMVCKPAFIQKNELMMKLFSPSPLYLVSRFIGLVIVYMVYFNIGPEFIISGATGGSMLGVSATLVSVILCIAFLMPLLTDFGIMEFVGVLVRNVVRPLFTVPGRSAVDLITSWMGTSNAAAILTVGQYEKGFYSAREAATISMNFSFVSLPFTYVIAKLIGVDHKFTIFYIICTLSGIILAAIMPRIPPLSKIPDTYDEISGKQIDESIPEGVSKIKWALNLAGMRAKKASSNDLLKQGLHVYSSMFMDLIPIVMAWGTLVLVLVEFTPIFNIISVPFEWYINIFGIEGAKEVAPTALVGFADMYIPPLMLANFPIERTRFIMGAATLLQIIYMTEVGLIILKSRVPVNVGHLFIVFLERTILAIPLVTMLTNLLVTF